jgi:hypothetical protein
VSARLRSRADLEAWLERRGYRWRVHEPTLRVAASDVVVDLAWRGGKGVELFVALPVDADDAALAAANGRLAIGGFIRRGPGVVFALTVFPDHEGALAPEIVERALDACVAAAARGPA